MFSRGIDARDLFIGRSLPRIMASGRGLARSRAGIKRGPWPDKERRGSGVESSHELQLVKNALVGGEFALEVLD
jgi:hypothetical protein